MTRRGRADTIVASTDMSLTKQFVKYLPLPLLVLVLLMTVAAPSPAVRARNEQDFVQRLADLHISRFGDGKVPTFYSGAHLEKARGLQVAIEDMNAFFAE